MLASVMIVAGYTLKPLPHASSYARAAGAARLPSPNLQAEDGPLGSAQTAFTIFQESQAEGVGFKQAVADALAGEYDRDAVTAEVQAAANASPLAASCCHVYASRRPQPCA